MDWDGVGMYWNGLGWGWEVSESGLGMSFGRLSIKWATQAVYHVFLPRRAPAIFFDPCEEDLTNSLTSLAWHKWDVQWPKQAPGNKLPYGCHGIHEGELWNEKARPGLASMLATEHGYVGACKVIGKHRIVKHVLDIARIHVVSVPTSKQERRPEAMKYMPKHIPPLSKVALRHAPGSLLIALGVGS